MKNILKTFFFSTLLVSILSSCCSTKTVYCPDGRPVNYQKNIKCLLKAYQDQVKETEVTLKANIQEIVDIADLQVKNTAKLLREKLDNRSARYQDALKASLYAVSMDPCENSKHHYKLVSSAALIDADLEKLNLQLKQAQNNNEIEKVMNDYLYERGKVEGKAMGKLTSTLDKYFLNNNKYPENFNSLGIDSDILLLGENRIEYQKINDSKYSLRFAGEDYALNTNDDKVYTGENGVTKLNQ